MHNLGYVWLADFKGLGRPASSARPKPNKKRDAANSEHKAMLSRGKIANYTPVINFSGCHYCFQQPIKQLQPSAFPSLVLGKEKDDSLRYAATGAVHLSRVPAGR